MITQESTKDGSGSGAEFVDLYRPTEQSTYAVREEDRVVNDRDVRGPSGIKPRRFGQSDSYYTSESDYSNYDSDPYENRRYRPDYASKNILGSNANPRSRSGSRSKTGSSSGSRRRSKSQYYPSSDAYESDTELYELRTRLAEVGASQYFKPLLKQGVTSVEDVNLEKLERLPIKSSQARSRLLRAFSHLGRRTKNIKSKLYRALSGSGTSDTGSADEDDDDDSMEDDRPRRRKSILKRGRSGSRASPHSHRHDPSESSLTRKGAVKRQRSKSVTFDLEEDDEYSMPSGSDSSSDTSDSEISLYSDDSSSESSGSD